ncbi:glutaminyl-peptide cyclotransferase, partial [Streptomyces sp. NPDC059956]
MLSQSSMAGQRTTEPAITRRKRARPGTRTQALVVVAAIAGALLPGPAEPRGLIRNDDATQTTFAPATHGRPPVRGQAMATAPGNAAASPRIRSLRAVVRATLPHDPQAFTQGLEFRGATLYESTGLVGRSSLRAGPPGKRPTRQVELPAPLFGEGITFSGAKLWQLTWRNGIAIERDATTLEERRRVSFPGEGWGLCHQRIAGRERLVMSDGTDRLTFRDSNTFTATGGINVRKDDAPATRLNELECAPDGSIYANVY